MGDIYTEAEFQTCPFFGMAEVEEVKLFLCAVIECFHVVCITIPMANAIDFQNMIICYTIYIMLTNPQRDLLLDPCRLGSGDAAEDHDVGYGVPAEPVVAVHSSCHLTGREQPGHRSPVLA